ncbi:hypothetical protein Hanom_Chr08g00683171 [Helianthus anomalus]
MSPKIEIVYNRKRRRSLSDTMERRTKKKMDHSTLKDTTNRQLILPKIKKSTSDFKKGFRSSHRLRAKMYKSRFKNTIDRPLVCSDSETSNKDDKDGDDGMNDAGNTKTREDIPPSIKNTQGAF